jgi:hypothetical protein
MGLYPNILFHFTDKGGLFNILEDTFKVSYAREKIKGQTLEREFAVPMVSFCDLRLSELKEHIEKYGKFGIGLTKEWAFRNGLNPVMYVNETSHFTDNFIKALDGIYAMVNRLVDAEDTNNLSNDYMNVLNTYRYLKNYQGDLKRNKEIIKDYRFADEREWRYVPPISEKLNYRPFIPISRIKIKEEKNRYNQDIGHIKLHFVPDDINYLIVDNDKDINPLIRHLRNVKNRFDQDTIERLTSRILTSDQIKNDI